MLRAIAFAAVTISIVACGKRGSPLPPLRPVPVAVANLAAERIGDEITLRFNVPDANVDGSTPPRIDAVEVYSLTQPASAKPPTAAELVIASHRMIRIDVRREAESTDAKPAARKDPRPVPGDPVTAVDKVPATAPAEPSVRYYVAMGLAGRRRGPTSAILALPLSSLPDPPSGIKADFTEQNVRIAWTRGAATDRFLVEEVDKAAGTSKRLTPVPIEAGEFLMPVEFGRERCLAVRTATVGTNVSSVSALSAPQCVTPVDRFAPAAPTGLLAVASEGAIDLLWTASAAADVAGYVILRGEGADGTLQRLTPALVTTTQYRDQAVKPGITYVYQVIAVDKSTPPNESEGSNRQVVTAREIHGPGL